jgi:hypothetical protein
MIRTDTNDQEAPTEARCQGSNARSLPWLSGNAYCLVALAC